MHAVARRVWGAARAWLAVEVVLVLGSFESSSAASTAGTRGMSSPTRHALRTARAHHPQPQTIRTIAATAVFAGFLGATYLVFYAFARLSNMLGDESRSV